MASAFALALALAVPTEPNALEALIAFSDPARCVPAPKFDALLHDLWTSALGDHPWEAAQTVIKPYDGLFTGPAGLLYGNNGRVMVSVGTKGSWHGVRLFGFGKTALPGAKGTTLTLNFGAPMATVQTMLSAQGFRFGAADNGIDISLTPDQGDGGPMTLLTCAPHD